MSHFTNIGKTWFKSKEKAINCICKRPLLAGFVVDDPVYVEI